MRVILDSNVVIAAVAARGLCESLLELCLEHHEIILCEGILKEIEEKLTGKLRVALPVAEQYLDVLRNNASLYEPKPVKRDVCRDPNDRMILGLAIAGNAEIIISGDKDLLVIEKYGGAKIVTPRQFWDRNRQK